NGGIGVRAGSGVDLTLDGCGVYRNAAHGIRADGVTHLERCRIQGNSMLGVFLLGSASAVVRDCVIAGNVSSGVKAVNCVHSSIESCTITANHAPFGGGGIQMQGGAIDVVNSVIWGNCSDLGGWQIVPGFGATVTVTCSAVEAALIAPPTGSGSITLHDLLEQDPLICSPADCLSAPTAAGDYGLASNSPALTQSCGPMGAGQPLCTPTSLSGASWGKVKAGYR
ncbi:MAG TPA: right-handed parallel beta-helix repeat-containing protein, partial [bacterium]|nr:right-handed parallel beta-helix repeat-containing protein [bacterium]